MIILITSHFLSLFQIVTIRKSLYDRNTYSHTHEHMYTGILRAKLN